MMKYEYTLVREDEETEIIVSYNYYKASKGARDSCCGVRGAGPALEPDQSATVEVLSAVSFSSGREVELSNKETERIAEAILMEED
jgi:hypothetical protein